MLNSIIERWKGMSWGERFVAVCFTPFAIITAMVAGLLLFLGWGLVRTGQLFGVIDEWGQGESL